MEKEPSHNPRGSIQILGREGAKHLDVTGIIPYQTIVGFAAGLGADEKLLNTLGQVRENIRGFLTKGIRITTQGEIINIDDASKNHSFILTTSGFAQALNFRLEQYKQRKVDFFILEGLNEIVVNGPVRALDAYVAKMLKGRVMPGGVTIGSNILVKQILIEFIEERDKLVPKTALDT